MKDEKDHTKNNLYQHHHNFKQSGTFKQTYIKHHSLCYTAQHVAYQTTM